MSLRLFLAIPIPDPIADRLLALETDVPGAAWRTREHFHLTLRFIGEVDEATARDIDGELGRIIAAPFEISLSGVDSFGGREPSALWAGVSAPPDLQRLVASCESAVRRAGLAPESRKYRPHVTLAYLRGTYDTDVANYLQDAASFRTEPFWVDHYAMYSSHHTHYREQAIYPLTG
jgi:2'-5' RNA ligase